MPFQTGCGLSSFVCASIARYVTLAYLCYKFAQFPTSYVVGSPKLPFSARGRVHAQLRSRNAGSGQRERLF